MREDRQHWNRKHGVKAFPPTPSAVVKAYHGLAPGRRVLDLACGNGRNALYLARRGFLVLGVDIADVALRRCRPRPARVQLVCADLDVFSMPRAFFHLILNIRYLNRALFPMMEEGLAPGGLLIFETYLLGPEGTGGGRFREDHLLRPGELRQAFARLNEVHYRERPSRDPAAPSRIATLVARRPF
jgi:SAM-dependent methyltransferase